MNVSAFCPTQCLAKPTEPKPMWPTKFKNFIGEKHEKNETGTWNQTQKGHNFPLTSEILV